MKLDKVFVFDTNSIVSAHLIAGSVSDQTFQKALRLGAIAISETTMIELVDVLYRKKFDKYFNEEQAREKLIQKIEEYAVTFSPSEKKSQSALTQTITCFWNLMLPLKLRALFQVTLICTLLIPSEKFQFYLHLIS
jgi:hypothetical protein